MAICGSCGAETSRVRTTFHATQGKYVGQTDECPSCAPGSFEPQWMRERPVPAYEAYPTRYKPVRLEDGRISYVATDEWRADQEDRIMKPCADDVKTKEKAIARRREWAKAQPRKLTASQLESINNRRDQILSSLAARGAGVRQPNE